MSSRGTLFLTPSGDHWYEDWSTLSPASTPEDQIPNIHISIDYKDIISLKILSKSIEKIFIMPERYENLNPTIHIEINGDSDLARGLRETCFGTKKQT